MATEVNFLSSDPIVRSKPALPRLLAKTLQGGVNGRW